MKSSGSGALRRLFGVFTGLAGVAFHKVVRLCLVDSLCVRLLASSMPGTSALLGADGSHDAKRIRMSQSMSWSQDGRAP